MAIPMLLNHFRIVKDDKEYRVIISRCESKYTPFHLSVYRDGNLVFKVGGQSVDEVIRGAPVRMTCQ